MKRIYVITILILGAALFVVSCERDKPAIPDGENDLTLVAVDTSGVTGEGWAPIEGATINISSTSFVFDESYITDAEGCVFVGGLPAGNYNIMAEKSNELENILILGQKHMRLIHDPACLDTVFMAYITSSPLVLNEVYYCGCSASAFYFYDQFIELYNSSKDTLYLDGFVMCRGTQMTDIIDFEAVDYALAYYVYQFPGARWETKTCPIAPGQFLVLAGDAYDHSGVSPHCVDLTDADWEFVNPLKHDIDDPYVPNLDPVSTWGVDFTYNLGHAALWLSTGEDLEFVEHYDPNLQRMKMYIHTPLWTVIDAVEYSSNPDSEKYVTVRIDAGLGGNGMIKYSAKSIQRRYPGLDSNNSTFDFEIVYPPTPGRQD